MEDVATMSPPDVEAAGEGKLHANNQTLPFMEAAAMLTVWSLLVINEGAIRLVQSNPSLGLFESDSRIVPFFPFLGGLFEVFFGLLGFFVGFAALILRWHSPLFTKLSMAVQSVMGWFVFILFVIALPAVRAADRVRFHTFLSPGENRLLITMGILTSFNFCLALQGGQFLFFGRLVSAATGQDFLKSQSGNKMRAVFWNMNLAASGLWTIIAGSLVLSSIGGGKIAEPFMAAPHVGVLPAMTVTAGVLMLIGGLAGAALAASGSSVPGAYYVGAAFVYLFAYLNFTIVQFGQLDVTVVDPIDGATALHGGLVFMVVALGPYFVNKADRERKGEAY
eukprot:gb/GEZJ01000469.1/.p1 GENE.gb/GEZJ01000469.1/~~gb/GEZJ01000469.1/.p1  ORF type:complete len:336 (-),score=56.34 gb/GEZJ01000469.1/:343-1350(-)